MTRTAEDDRFPVLAGAEAWSSPGGGPHGALALHGFTGNPNSMRGVAEALAGAGFAVELPRLPGHGTDIEDMLDTTFADWSAAAEAALERLRARLGDGGRIVVAGLSMGGLLTVWLATRHAGLPTHPPQRRAPASLPQAVHARAGGLPSAATTRL